MRYGDFTLDMVRKVLGITLQQANLFEQVRPAEVPAWLREALDKGTQLALLSEKSRSEFVVAPILLAGRELCGNKFAIYSGQRLDVDADRGLVGECDFILTLTLPLPVLQAPVAVILEAKEGDVEAGLGQCAAQMVGAQVFNQNEGRAVEPIFGCVTTGEAWQFLKLQGSTLWIDRDRYYIHSVATLLGIFQVIVATYPPGAVAA
jgi:hypothetical protein